MSFKLKLEDKNFKDTKKITWVLDNSSEKLVPITAIEYGSLITKPLVPKVGIRPWLILLYVYVFTFQGEDLALYVNRDSKFQAEFLGSSALSQLKLGDIIQINRKGFFICDQAHHELLGRPLVLIYIPDGHEKEQNISHNPLLTLTNVDKAKQLEDETAAQSKIVKELKTTKADKDAIRKAEEEHEVLKSNLTVVQAAVSCLVQ